MVAVEAGEEVGLVALGLTCAMTRQSTKQVSAKAINLASTRMG